jgi:Glycosyltransferase family 87
MLRENALCAFVAAVASATMAWLGLYGFAWNDYETEARPAFDALAQGHVVEFLRLAPVYGGSLFERAPFALLPSLWGGGELAVYRMVALPCLLAAAALGLWLVARMRAARRPRFSRAVVLGLCVASPLTLQALEIGHPEELLGACMCIAAVLLANRNRMVPAALILGLAIANKEWALLAIGPVLLALPAKRRLLCLTIAGLVAVAVLAPLALVSSGGFLSGTQAIASAPSSIFQPWQAWWFLGHHGALVHGLFGSPKVGYRIAPSWVGAVSHPLILLVGAAVTASLWLSRRRRGEAGALLGERDALLALALLLLMRCVLDTWDTEYYVLPFVFALLTWEATGPGERPPLLALSSTMLVWLSFQWAPAHISADAEAALFLAWSLPLLGMLGVALYRPRRVLGERYELLRQAREPLTASVANQHQILDAHA